MNKENLHSGHRERLRKKFIDFGSEIILEHEILELLLFYAIPRMNTNEVAHCLIKEFGNLNSVLNAPSEELKKIKGIGQSSVDFLKFFADLCSEYNSFSEFKKNTVTENNITEYLCNYFNGKNPDLCLLLSIDNRFQIQNHISFIKKDIIRDNNEIKRIIEFLLCDDCSEVIMGINHPERNAVPDKTDFTAFKILSEKLSVLNFTITDCIICSDRQTFSFKQQAASSF